MAESAKNRAPAKRELCGKEEEQGNGRMLCEQQSGGSGLCDDEKRVPLLIPRDAANPEEDSVVVIVNGKVFQIRRGVEVMVPPYVRQVYLDSEAQKLRAYEQSKRAEDRN